jgi:hypothetical protein
MLNLNYRDILDSFEDTFGKIVMIKSLCSFDKVLMFTIEYYSIYRGSKGFLKFILA